MIVRRLSTKTKVTLLATSLFLLSLAIVSSVQLHYVGVKMKRVLAAQQLVFVSHIANELDQHLLRDLAALTAVANVLPPELVTDVEKLEQWLTERAALRSLFNAV